MGGRPVAIHVSCALLSVFWADLDPCVVSKETDFKPLLSGVAHVGETFFETYDHLVPKSDWFQQHKQQFIMVHETSSRRFIPGVLNGSDVATDQLFYLAENARLCKNKGKPELMRKQRCHVNNVAAA